MTARPIDHQACGLYTPGHQVHWIQAKLAWEGDPSEYLEGALLEVDDDGWITLQVDGKALRFWNHDPARARECFEASEGRVGLPGNSVLHAPHEDGRYCICISTNGPTPCLPAPPSTPDPLELVEQMRTHGGFSVPGEAILHDLEGRRNR
jgi:hypothetical protein